MHHKYHAHPAPAAAPATQADVSAVNAGLPAAAAVVVEMTPLHTNMEDLSQDIKLLREDIAGLRQGMQMHVTASAAAAAADVPVVAVAAPAVTIAAANSDVATDATVV